MLFLSQHHAAQVDKLTYRSLEYFCAKIVGGWGPLTLTWKQAGKIIEDRGITLMRVNDGWTAHMSGSRVYSKGSTALEAVMRCIVRDHYGPEITYPY